MINESGEMWILNEELSVKWLLFRCAKQMMYLSIQKSRMDMLAATEDELLTIKGELTQKH